MDIFSIRKNFIISQLVVLTIALLYEYTIGNSNNYTFILLYSLWNGCSYIWLFIKEMKYSPDFHPFQILALVCAQFIGFSGISIYSELINGEKLYFGSTMINSSVYMGVIYLSLQHILLFAIFYYFENRHKYDDENSIKIADRIIGSRVPYFKWALLFYVFVWFMRFLSLIIPLSTISSVLVNLSTGGYILTLFLLLFEMIKTPNNEIAMIIHWVIVAIEIAIVMNHGMKEEIIRPLVPYCVYLIIMFKSGYISLNSKTIVKVGVISAFVIFFVFPYVSIFRSFSIKKGKSWNEISTTEVLTEYHKYLNNEGIYANKDQQRSAGYFMSRAGSIGCNAFSINYAKTKGTKPEYLAYCGTAIIPRFIWKNKPTVVTGGMAYRLATGDSNWLKPQKADNYGCSVSLGYIGSLYFSIGLFGAIIIITLQSCFLWYLWFFYKYKILYNIVALWAFISFLFVLLKDFESFQDCGLNFCAFSLVYLFICSLLFRGPKHLVNL